MILLIDNYDSFVYNVYQYVCSIDPDVKVIRNDEMTIEEIERIDPKMIILSPGPGKPSEAGICEDVIRHFYQHTKILGICLGHQAICEVFDTPVIHANRIMHGKQSMIHTKPCTLFDGLPESFKVARYHSLIADQTQVSEKLEVIATTDSNEIMAVKVKGANVYGVQFHPESILTEYGMDMIRNILEK